MFHLQQWITEHFWQCIAGSLAKKRYYRACTYTWDCSDRQQKLWSNWRWKSAGHLGIQKSPMDIVLCAICLSDFSFHHSTSSLQYHIHTKQMLGIPARFASTSRTQQTTLHLLNYPGIISGQRNCYCWSHLPLERRMGWSGNGGDQRREDGGREFRSECNARRTWVMMNEAINE